jgi:tetratricopeptide (TPR) repeat protein
LKRSTDAVRAFAAVAMAATFGVVFFGVPSCSRASGDSLEALRRVDRLLATERYSDALPLALDNRQRHPEDSAAAWQVARAYGGLGTLADEAAAWETYLRLAPPTHDVCLRLSDVYQRLAQPAQVIALVDRCLALDDRQSELLGDLATASLERHDSPAAAAALRRGLAIDPGNNQFRARLRALERPSP